MKSLLDRLEIMKNSLLIVIGSLSNSIINTIFWIFVTNLIHPNLVGLTIGIISALTIIALICRLGQETSFMRFPLDINDQNRKFVMEGLLVSNIFTVLLATLYVIGLRSQNLFIEINMFILIILVLIILPVTLLNFGFVDAILISLSFSQLITFKNLIAGISKILIILILTSMSFVIQGEHAILLSWTIGNSIALFFAFFFISKKVKGLFANKNYTESPNATLLVSRKDYWFFSFANYVINLSAALPQYIFPLIVIYLFGNAYAAYLYMPWMLTSVVFTIAVSSHSAFLVETSRGNSKRESTILAFSFSFIIVFLSIGGTILFGEIILGLFGESYSNIGILMLLILMITNLPATLNSFLLTLARQRRKMKINFLCYLIILILSVGFSIASANIFNFISIGVAWLISNSIGTLILLFWYIRSSPQIQH